jgi:hypothetical protein
MTAMKFAAAAAFLLGTTLAMTTAGQAQAYYGGAYGYGYYDYAPGPGYAPYSYGGEWGPNCNRGGPGPRAGCGSGMGIGAER